MSTIQSAPERRHRKELARRKRVSHAYRYEPLMTREGFSAGAVASAAGELKGAAAGSVFAAFLDLAANANQDNLDRLEALGRLFVIARPRIQRGIPTRRGWPR